MLQWSMTHHTAVVRMFVTAVFVVLGWAYLHSVLMTQGSEAPSGQSIDYPPAERSAAPSAAIGLDSDAAVLDHPAFQGEHDSPSPQRRFSGQTSENQSGRRQALTILTALLVQIQGSGVGGK